MSSYPVREIRKALSAKGFAEEQSHHALFRLVVRGKTTSIRARLSHGARELRDALLAQVARQMPLSRRELDDFVECQMGHADYVAALIERGVLKPAP